MRNNMQHSHNGQPNHNAKMMWWMIVGCLLLPLLLLLFFSTGDGVNGGTSWAWLVFVAVFAAAHVGMFLGHGKQLTKPVHSQKITACDHHSESVHHTNRTH